MTMRRLWINNESVTGSSGTHAAIDPATEETIAEVSWGDVAETDQAIAAASAAFPAWKQTPASERARLLHEAATRLREHKETIAVELTRETGRTIVKNRGYVQWSAEAFDYFAELGRHGTGRLIAPPERSQLSMVMKAPHGVVGCILPWNYPLLLLAWKLAPALAAGNTVVIKPAEYTTWCSLGFTRFLDHFPPGVVNIISGKGSQVGERLVTHPDVRMIAFTGSVEIGQHIMRQAAAEMKRLNLELGGKDPLIVCRDADIGEAAQAAAWGGFLNAGQVCTSIERVYVEQPVYSAFIDEVVRRTERLKIGPGIEESTHVTPMIRSSERAKVARMVADAGEGGAEILTGGKIPDAFPRGFFFEPTVLAGVTDDMTLSREEIFGPLLPVVAFDEFEEAIARVNDQPFGLGATLFTNDARKVKYYFENIEAGNVWVNDPLIDNVAGPFGGYKRSGLGRELGVEGLEAFLETKHVHWEIEGGMKSWWWER